ncbi:MAG: hypothetical protein O3A01_05625 [bacterium]|nr:hypothetical protein [bacterium]
MFKRVALLGESDVDFFGADIANAPVAELHGHLVTQHSMSVYVDGFCRAGDQPTCPFDRNAGCSEFAKAIGDLSIDTSVLPFDERYCIKNLERLIDRGDLAAAINLVDVICEQDGVDFDVISQHFEEGAKASFNLFDRSDEITQRLRGYFDFNDVINEGAESDAPDGFASSVRDSLLEVWQQKLSDILAGLSEFEFASLGMSDLLKIADFYVANYQNHALQNLADHMLGRCQLGELKLEPLHAVHWVTYLHETGCAFNAQLLFSAIYESPQHPVIDSEVFAAWMVKTDLSGAASVFEKMPINWVCLSGNKWCADVIDELYVHYQHGKEKQVDKALAVLVRRADSRYLTSAVTVRGVDTTLTLMLSAMNGLSMSKEALSQKMA